jgi:UDP-N-acetylglucosamine 1-carboxyvinyltransferase
VDIFLDGFKELGATVHESDDSFEVQGKLRGTEIFLRILSVTATQTLMMAAVLAEGKTVIKNAALEPETENLARFLNECGAKISGYGTTTITIEGTGLLEANGRVYKVPPDRIEAGSFAILGALSAEELIVDDCEPYDLEAVIDTLRRAGASVEINKSQIIVRAPKILHCVDIKTHEYPGFPTDVQAPMVVLLTQALGESLVFETIFEGRLNYTEGLARMGADIKLWDTHRATVKGPTDLNGKTLDGPDIRAGLAYIIAGTIAEGETIIHNAYMIDRGYEMIEERLKLIGVNISRVYDCV